MTRGAAPFRLDPEALACPYPHYEQLRLEGRAVWVDEVAARVVTGYADICELLRRPALASSRTPTGPVSAAVIADRIDHAQRHGLLPAAAQRYLRTPHDRTLFTIDPPDHTRQRRVVARFFAPQKVEAWTPLVRRVAGDLVDQYVTAGGGDFVAAVAVPLPVQVIATLLRIPPEDHGRLKAWSNQLTAVIGVHDPSLEAVAGMLAGRAEMMEYFSGLLAEARAHPGPDLVTDVAFGGAQDEDAKELTESERVGLLINFLVAGNETSTKLFAQVARALAELPDLWARLRADPALIAVLVDEVLRLEPPTQAMYRQLTADAPVGGEPCRAGQHVLLVFAAGNRDETEFPEPDRLDLDRSGPARHLSFGHGAHLCLGAGLARMEARVLVHTLLERTGGLHLQPHNDFACEHSYLLHGLRHLDLAVDGLAPEGI
jgi:cytochrome P450